MIVTIRRDLQRSTYGVDVVCHLLYRYLLVTFSGQDFECTTVLYGADRTEEPCDVGVATHVFDDTLAEDDIFRWVGQSTS